MRVEKMEENNTTLFTVIVTLIGTLGSAQAWQFWSSRQKIKQEQSKAEINDKNLYRDDLRKEVERLRSEMKRLYTDRDKLRDDIADLRAELAEMKTLVTFLREENRTLKENGSWPV